MDLVVLTEFIIKRIVSDSESVSVKEFESIEDDTIQIEVVVSSIDLGRVIGKNGRIINSIKTILQSAATLNGMGRVKLNIDSY